MFIKEHWGEILIQLVLFGLPFGLLNLSITFATTRLAASQQVKRLAGAKADEAALGDAMRFAMKNTFIIPISMIYLLRMLQVI